MSATISKNMCKEEGPTIWNRNRLGIEIDCCLEVTQVLRMDYEIEYSASFSLDNLV